MDTKCIKGKDPCFATPEKSTYCGLDDSTGSYYKKDDTVNGIKMETDFAGGCSSCIDGPKSCQDMIDRFISKDQCHVGCSNGWNDYAQNEVATQFRCTDAEITSMKNAISKNSGREFSENNELSDGNVIQSSLVALIGVFLVGVGLVV
tara:strand:+ start:95 stop:538 length:444 start_codon:yes stop_codon:yes gene_type:complete